MVTGNVVYAFISIRRPEFRNSADKLAYAVNSVFMAHGFHLYLTGAWAFPDTALSAYYEVDIDGWNELEDRYAFVYFHPTHESKMKLHLKCFVIDNKHLLMEAISAADCSRPAYLNISIDDFVEDISDDDDRSVMYHKQFKNLDLLVTYINTFILFKLNWFPKPLQLPSSNNNNNNSNNYISTKSSFFPKPTYNSDTRKEENPPQGYMNQSLENKFASMRLAEKKEKEKEKKKMMKKKKKVKSASISKPYKRRTVKDNMKNNSPSGASKKEHSGGATLYDLPLDVYDNMKLAIGMLDHLETHKDDKKAMKDLERYEYYIDILSSCHRSEPGELPSDWTYNRATAREDISKCYWEKVSYFES